MSETYVLDPDQLALPPGPWRKPRPTGSPPMPPLGQSAFDPNDPATRALTRMLAQRQGGSAEPPMDGLGSFDPRAIALAQRGRGLPAPAAPAATEPSGPAPISQDVMNEWRRRAGDEVRPVPQAQADATSTALFSKEVPRAEYAQYAADPRAYAVAKGWLTAPAGQSSDPPMPGAARAAANPPMPLRPQAVYPGQPTAPGVTVAAPRQEADYFKAGLVDKLMPANVPAEGAAAKGTVPLTDLWLTRPVGVAPTAQVGVSTIGNAALADTQAATGALTAMLKGLPEARHPLEPFEQNPGPAIYRGTEGPFYDVEGFGSIQHLPMLAALARHQREQAQRGEVAQAAQGMGPMYERAYQTQGQLAGEQVRAAAERDKMGDAVVVNPDLTPDQKLAALDALEERRRMAAQQRLGGAQPPMPGQQVGGGMPPPLFDQRGQPGGQPPPMVVAPNARQALEDTLRKAGGNVAKDEVAAVLKEGGFVAEKPGTNATPNYEALANALLARRRIMEGAMPMLVAEMKRSGVPGGEEALARALDRDIIKYMNSAGIREAGDLRLERTGGAMVGKGLGGWILTGPRDLATWYHDPAAGSITAPLTSKFVHASPFTGMTEEQRQASAARARALAALRMALHDAGKK